jgi:hypothetical protein
MRALLLLYIPLSLAYYVALPVSRRVVVDPADATEALAGCPSQFQTDVNVTIGSATFSLLLDTASTSLVVAAEGCTGCAGVSPLLPPSPSLGAAAGGYGTGSFTGSLRRDAVSVAGLPPVEMTFAAAEAASGLFASPAFGCAPRQRGNTNQGILGVGPPSLLFAGTESWLDLYFASLSVEPVLGLVLCQTQGLMYLGGHPTADLFSVPSSGRYYGVPLTTISAGGFSLATAGVPAFVDTGTNGNYLPTALFGALVQSLALYDELFQQALGAGAAAFLGSSGYWAVKDAAALAALPELVLTVGALTLRVPALGGYLELASGQAVSVLVPAAANRVVLGWPFMTRFLVVFSRGAVSFATPPPGLCRDALPGGLVSSSSSDAAPPPPTQPPAPPPLTAYERVLATQLAGVPPKINHPPKKLTRLDTGLVVVFFVCVGVLVCLFAWRPFSP